MMKYSRIEISGTKRRMSLPAVILVLLICMVLTTGATFSRYVIGDRILEQARVAGFDISVSFPDNKKIEMKETSGTTKDYTFTVTNNSEVAVSYDIRLSLPQPLPEGIILSMGETIHEGDGSMTEVTFPGGELSANGGTGEHTITIDAVYTTLSETYYCEGSISVTAVQID